MGHVIADRISRHTTAETTAFARRGIAMVLGPNDAFIPQLWVDDAATAVVAALRDAPPGVYETWSTTSR